MALEPQEVSLIQRLADETATNLIALKNDLQALRETVISLSKIIRDGGEGYDPLVTRARLIEAQIRELNERVDREKREVHKRLDDLAAEDLANVQGSWQLKVAIITALGSLIAAAIALLN
ncbi:MAG TPA: hypothetical protein V6D03_12815 [Candidatus Caenarcaniphilales bacterium]|jgi:hypothetical protein